MIYEYPNIEAFNKAANENPALLKAVSPGHVRTVLGVTRQAVFKLVKRGVLDEVRIGCGLGTPIVLILEDSCMRFKDSPMRARAPNFRQRLQHESDRVRGLWPNDEVA